MSSKRILKELKDLQKNPLYLLQRRYVDRIANAKWEVKELGMEHNGYVDLLLGEFKHYRTRIVHGDIHKEVQELLLDYGVEIVTETLVEGLSQVKRCTDEGRALMSLDLQDARRPSADFMEKVQKDINPVMRAILNGWLVEVAVTCTIIATSFNQILFFSFCSRATCALVLLPVFRIINIGCSKVRTYPSDFVPNC